MPAKILILDSAVTRRAVLKAKMQAAQFCVETCADQADALACIEADRPDLLLVHLGEPAADFHAFCRSLRNTPATASIAIIATGLPDTAKARFAALDAGADDALTEPLNDAFMHARIRSLLRVRSARQELMLRETMVSALGFDEQQAGYAPQGQIAFVKDPVLPHPGMLDDLHHHTVDLEAALDVAAPLAAIDVVIIDARNIAGGDRNLFSFVSDLRAREATRYTAQLVIVPPGSFESAALLLDLGADDVMQEGHSKTEVSLRVKALVHRKRQQDMLRKVLQNGLQAALTDPLTGLYNRRYCDPHLALIADEARSSGRTFAVLMIDIDHFKAINDRYGHAAGDEALVALSQRLRDNLRAIDTIARVGGEEFLVIMPRTSVRQARLAADRLRRIINNAGFDIGRADAVINMTISVGVAVSAHDHAHGYNANKVCQNADQALFAAKSAGRNRVAMGRSAA